MNLYKFMDTAIEKHRQNLVNIINKIIQNPIRIYTPASNLGWNMDTNLVFVFGFHFLTNSFAHNFHFSFTCEIDNNIFCYCVPFHWAEVIMLVSCTADKMAWKSVSTMDFLLLIVLIWFHFQNSSFQFLHPFLFINFISACELQLHFFLVGFLWDNRSLSHLSSFIITWR